LKGSIGVRRSLQRGIAPPDCMPDSVRGGRGSSTSACPLPPVQGSVAPAPSTVLKGSSGSWSPATISTCMGDRQRVTRLHSVRVAQGKVPRPCRPFPSPWPHCASASAPTALRPPRPEADRRAKTSRFGPRTLFLLRILPSRPLSRTSVTLSAFSSVSVRDPPESGLMSIYRFRGSDRREVAMTGLHVQPRLAVGGMSARQVLILPVVKNQMLCPTAPTAGACLSRLGKTRRRGVA
jgi:hypothetical protein